MRRYRDEGSNGNPDSASTSSFGRGTSAPRLARWFVLEEATCRQGWRSGRLAGGPSVLPPDGLLRASVRRGRLHGHRDGHVTVGAVTVSTCSTPRPSRSLSSNRIAISTSWRPSNRR